ncbi:MAG: ATP synthase F1 subunit epsilon [Chlorobiales bacterium]|nr:ATP synthase F1 subunit epsilon [Chlorobiales bacterium]
MAGNVLTLDVVTPVKAVFSGEIISVTAPGDYGSFQVLKDHAPMLASLGAGEVKLVLPNKSEQTFKVNDGFFEVSNNKAILLAESVS